MKKIKLFLYSIIAGGIAITSASAQFASVTFKVDMTHAIEKGQFNPDSQFVDIAGNWKAIEQWDTYPFREDGDDLHGYKDSTKLVEDPYYMTREGTTNIYSFTAPEVPAPGSYSWKARIKSEWSFFWTEDKDPDGNKKLVLTAADAGTEVTAGPVMYMFKFDTIKTSVLNPVKVKRANIHPVPVVNVINVDDANVKSYAISTISGLKVMEGTIENNAIAVQDLQKGVYVIQLTNAEGVPSVQKFTKE
jgi:hypothetical protein